MRPKETSTGFRLRKPCKLHHKLLVDALFDSGESLYAYPLRLTWRKVDTTTLQQTFRKGKTPAIGKVQVLITVPKRKVHHAVDRVLIRRRIREAFRLQLPSFEAIIRERTDIESLSLGLIYIAKENETYELIERKLIRLLNQLCTRL